MRPDMKILHTSDWHLGQTLHQYERSYEHARFLDWLLDQLEAEQVDALLIAGDIFDNTNPSAASQQQLYRFLQQARIRVPHLAIVMTAGNHDSPGRIEAPGPLLSLLDANAIGAVGRPLEPDDASGEEAADRLERLDRLIVPLKDRAGQIAAWCIAMPFLRPADLPRIEGEGEGQADPYLAGMALLYRQAWQRVQSKRSPDQAVIAMGHCHMTGGQVSEESERRLVIGGAEALPAALGGFAARLLDLPADAEWVELADPARGVWRFAALRDGRLEACLFLAAGDAMRRLPQGAALAVLLGGPVEGAARGALLAGCAASGRTATERTVCACFGVGEKTLRQAIATQGLDSVAAIGRACRAGSNCGSCQPELKQILASCAAMAPTAADSAA